MLFFQFWLEVESAGYSPSWSEPIIDPPLGILTEIRNSLNPEACMRWLIHSLQPATVCSATPD